MPICAWVVLFASFLGLRERILRQTFQGYGYIDLVTVCRTPLVILGRCLHRSLSVYKKYGQQQSHQELVKVGQPSAFGLAGHSLSAAYGWQLWHCYTWLTFFKSLVCPTLFLLLLCYVVNDSTCSKIVRARCFNYECCVLTTLFGPWACINNKMRFRTGMGEYLRAHTISGQSLSKTHPLHIYRVSS